VSPQLRQPINRCALALSVIATGSGGPLSSTFIGYEGTDTICHPV
jgi:hypothetical protein